MIKKEKTGSTRPDRARRARIAAVQAVFQAEQLDMALNDVKVEFLLHRLKKPEGGAIESSLFKELMTQVDSRFDQINLLIDSSLKNDWTLDRIESVVRAILRIAIAEMLLKKTPFPILVSEYVVITDGFSSDAESKFVSGILNAVQRKVI